MIILIKRVSVLYLDIFKDLLPAVLLCSLVCVWLGKQPTFTFFFQYLSYLSDSHTFHRP